MTYEVKMKKAILGIRAEKYRSCSLGMIYLIQISTVNTSSSAELPKEILLRQVMLNLLFHEIFILILFPYRSGGWKKVCLDGSYIAKCQITNTSFSVLMFQDNLWRSGKCYINYLIFGA